MTLDLVGSEAPGVKVSHIFWTTERKYHIIMRDKRDYKRVKRAVKNRITKALPGVLANADPNGHCQTYEATIEFGYEGMNIYDLMREDI